ncbi:MAG: chaperone NapD [Halieaceae bacterium]
MRLNRRQLITGSTNEQQCHIASMVVQCLPENLPAVCASIEHLPSAEIPVKDNNGKMVVLLEMASEADLLDRIHEIESISGVISANLAYHQLDDQQDFNE